jgi:hypothetical protein
MSRNYYLNHYAPATSSPLPSPTPSPQIQLIQNVPTILHSPYQYQFEILNTMDFFNKFAVYYKDEGGKKNCIEIKLKVFGFQNEIVKTDVSQLLVLELYYYSEKSPGTPQFRVGQQNMNIISSKYDSETHITTIRLQITEVSAKKHNNQPFSILISSSNHQIHPLCCGRIDVKSKKAKNADQRKRKRDETEPTPPVSGNFSVRQQLNCNPVNESELLISLGERDVWIQNAKRAFQRLLWKVVGQEKYLEKDLNGKIVENFRPTYHISENPNEVIHELLRTCPSPIPKISASRDRIQDQPSSQIIETSSSSSSFPKLLSLSSLSTPIHLLYRENSTISSPSTSDSHTTDLWSSSISDPNPGSRYPQDIDMDSDKNSEHINMSDPLFDDLVLFSDANSPQNSLSSLLLDRLEDRKIEIDLNECLSECCFGDIW